MLAHGTEAPFCGAFLDNKRDGTYCCGFCGLPLFRSDAKFDSGTGWPSFFAPYDPSHIRYIRDSSHGMVRIEEVCARCGSHLGHVFPDGPPPTAADCLNSVSRQSRARRALGHPCRDERIVAADAPPAQGRPPPYPLPPATSRAHHRDQDARHDDTRRTASQRHAQRATRCRHAARRGHQFNGRSAPTRNTASARSGSALQ